MNILNWLIAPFKNAIETMDELEHLFSIATDREPEPGWADGPQEYAEEEL